MIDIKKISDAALSMLHTPIGPALAADDAMPKGQSKKYGVRENADWQKWTNELESEMRARGMSFSPVKWE